MLRIREHRIAINSIVKDERLSPNRRALMEILALYFDADIKPRKATTPDAPEPEFDPVAAKRDKDMLYNILINQFGNPKNIQWTEGQEGTNLDSQTRIELDAAEKIRDMFSIVIGDKA